MAPPPAPVPGCHDQGRVGGLGLAPCCQVPEDGCTSPVIGSTWTRGVEGLLHLLDLMLAKKLFFSLFLVFLTLLQDFLLPPRFSIQVLHACHSVSLNTHNTTGFLLLQSGS